MGQRRPIPARRDISITWKTNLDLCSCNHNQHAAWGPPTSTLRDATLCAQSLWKSGSQWLKKLLAFSFVEEILSLGRHFPKHDSLLYFTWEERLVRRQGIPFKSDLPTHRQTLNRGQVDILDSGGILPEGTERDRLGSRLGFIETAYNPYSSRPPSKN